MEHAVRLRALCPVPTHTGSRHQLYGDRGLFFDDCDLQRIPDLPDASIQGRRPLLHGSMEILAHLPRCAGHKLHHSPNAGSRCSRPGTLGAGFHRRRNGCWKLPRPSRLLVPATPATTLTSTEWWLVVNFDVQPGSLDVTKALPHARRTISWIVFRK